MCMYVCKHTDVHMSVNESLRKDKKNHEEVNVAGKRKNQMRSLKSDSDEVLQASSLNLQ